MIEKFFGKLYLTAFQLRHQYNKPQDGHFLRVAYIGNYKSNCGISTYNEDLLNSVLDTAHKVNPDIGIHVFAEYGKAQSDDSEYSKSERLDGDPEWITRCWSRGEHPKLNLIKAIIAFWPDIVHISHEYGIYPQAYYFTSLVSVLKAYGIEVVSTMHSVYEHKDKVVTENAPDHLIVHTVEAKLCLMKKGISESKITVIPHGSPISSDTISLLPPDWNTWQSEHTIFHAGFMFEYKGHLRMMNVISRLKGRYPDVHYIIQGSANPIHMAEHDAVYDKLVSLSKELGIEGNVTINRGFVSTDVLLSHIRTVKCCVLPYVTHPEHDVRATSGIARLVLTTETPLVVSDVHLFDDVKDVADVATSDDELYTAISNVFEQKGLSEMQKKKRLDFLAATSWSTIATKTLILYRRLLLKK